MSKLSECLPPPPTDHNWGQIVLTFLFKPLCEAKASSDMGRVRFSICKYVRDSLCLWSGLFFLALVFHSLVTPHIGGGWTDRSCNIKSDIKLIWVGVLSLYILSQVSNLPTQPNTPATKFKRNFDVGKVQLKSKSRMNLLLIWSQGDPIETHNNDRYSSISQGGRF